MQVDGKREIGKGLHTCCRAIRCVFRNPCMSTIHGNEAARLTQHTKAAANFIFSSEFAAAFLVNVSYVELLIAREFWPLKYPKGIGSLGYMVP